MTRGEFVKSAGATVALAVAGKTFKAIVPVWGERIV